MLFSSIFNELEFLKMKVLYINLLVLYKMKSHMSEKLILNIIILTIPIMQRQDPRTLSFLSNLLSKYCKI